MNNTVYDLIIIGGGINGVGIAVDAAGRGLKVLLCEQYDLASGTSSASSKLIHGGLRYLEHYEFNLVRKSLQERSILSKIAPHLVKPIEFIMPYKAGHRPFWLLRLGLFIYDLFSLNHKIPKSSTLNVRQDKFLLDSIEKALVYSDCQTDDARLVIENAKQAAKLGATILNYSKVTSLQHNNTWQVTVTDHFSKEQTIYTSKAIVNAAGPWINQVNSYLNISSDYQVKLVKGSHIVIPKFYAHDKAYILPNEDGRVIFLIPYFEKYLIVGTTDVDYQQAIEQVAISEEETKYLLNCISSYFNTKITGQDIVYTWSGVRALFDSQSKSLSKLSRDYKLELNTVNNLPIINIYGGKLTTYRYLSEQTVNLLKAYFTELKPAWTKNLKFTNNQFSDFEQYKLWFNQEYAWLKAGHSNRLLNQYGFNADLVLANSSNYSELGEDFGHDLYKAEIDYLVEKEWARTVDDILFRRTKLGLEFSEQQKQDLEKYF